MRFSRILVLSALLILPQAARVSACDLCGCYMPGPESTMAVVSNGIHIFTAVAEQYSRFGSLRDNGTEVANPTGQYLNSFNTQFVVGASFWEDRLSLQVALPYIYRDFKRPEGFEMDHGHESGIGDLSLLTNFRLFQWGHDDSVPVNVGSGKKVAAIVQPPSDWSGAVHVIAGIKFPTGDSSRIKEEFNENEIEGAPESGIHGHDLALGSGSFDGVFGAQFFTRYRSVFVEADVQYAWRGEGHYSYRYANDLTWNAGPGVFLWRDGNRSIAVEAVLSGEYKGKDTFAGESADDTGITALYLGPRVIVSFGNFSADAGLDLPLVLNNTSLQAVIDYRIRAAISYHF